MTITKADFGITKEGQKADLYTLTNANGLIAKITTYGGTVTELWVPDKNGQMGDVVLGFDNLRLYEEKSPYFGCIVGRYGNRIGKGKFTLDGKEYSLPAITATTPCTAASRDLTRIWNAEPFENDKASV